MEHVVFYPGAGGAPSFARVSSLDAAVSYVERLRNSANITEFSVYELTPVPLSMRAYYHVEVPAAEDATPAATSEADPPAAGAPEASSEAEPAAEELAVPAVEQAVQFALGDAAEAAAVEAEADEAADHADGAEDSADEPSEPEVATSEILAAAAAAASVTASSPEADDDDRSIEWVAEASVIEPAFVTPELPVLPSSSPPDASAAGEGDDELHLAVAPSVAVPLPPSLQVTPFAVAPPVGSPLPTPLAPEPADVADFPVEPAGQQPEAAPEAATADVVPASPGGRRSLGFFTR
jgi:hypothetical protein